MDPVADLLGGGRTIAYKTELARAVGSITAGVFLSQLWFWVNEWEKPHKPDLERWDSGWLMWLQEEITEQTALTRRESETARKLLRELKIITEDKRGIPMKIWFRLNKDLLYQFLRNKLTKPPTNLGGERQDAEPPADDAASDEDDDSTNVGGNAQQNLAENAKMQDTEPPSSDGGMRQPTIGTRASEISEKIIDRSTGQTDQGAPTPDDNEPESAVAVFLNENVVPEPVPASPHQSQFRSKRESSQPGQSKHEGQWQEDEGGDSPEDVQRNRETRLARLIVEMLGDDDFKMKDAFSVIRECKFDVVERQYNLWPTRAANPVSPGAYFRKACRQDWLSPYEGKSQARANAEAGIKLKINDPAKLVRAEAPAASTRPLTDRANLDAIHDALSDCAKTQLRNEAIDRAEIKIPDQKSRLEKYRLGKLGDIQTKMLDAIVEVARYEILAKRAAAPIVVNGRNYYDEGDARAAKIAADFN